MDEVDVQIISALLCFCKNLGVVLWDEAWYLFLDFARLAVLVRDECEEWLAYTVSISEAVDGKVDAKNVHRRRRPLSCVCTFQIDCLVPS